MQVDKTQGKVRVRNQFGRENVMVESEGTQFPVHNLFFGLADQDIEIEVTGDPKTRSVQKIVITRKASETKPDAT